jgi:hypothetical protein
MKCLYPGCEVGIADEFEEYCDDHFDAVCKWCQQPNEDWDGDGENVCTDCKVAEAEAKREFDDDLFI